jgi:hypothetical protein
MVTNCPPSDFRHRIALIIPWRLLSVRPFIGLVTADGAIE